MSLIIATGTNLGDKLTNLAKARELLSGQFKPIAQSSVYCSAPVGFKDQPSFYNQALEFSLPDMAPQETMRILLKIEEELGRKRVVKWGPRIIDLDIIFWGTSKIHEEDLIVPHPRWAERAFVVLPLRELPFFQVLQKSFKIPEKFDHHASIVSK